MSEFWASFQEYLEYIDYIEELSIKDKIEYEIILNLRKKEGIDLDLFYKKYHQ